MNDFKKIEKISDLLLEIMWPENYEVYFTTTHQFNIEIASVRASIYVSELDEEKCTHKEGSWGKYFKVTFEPLDFCIKLLKKEFKLRNK
jgi:hypothetical protein